MWILLIPILLIFLVIALIYTIMYIIKGPKTPFFYGYAMVNRDDFVSELWRVELNKDKINILVGKMLLHSFNVAEVADVVLRREKEPDKIMEKDKNMLIRAAAGGLLFGGAGAIIGAMTAIKPTQKTIKGKEETYILIGLRDGMHIILQPIMGYEYAFNNFCAKFRVVQRLGITESPVS